MFFNACMHARGRGRMRGRARAHEGAAHLRGDGSAFAARLMGITRAACPDPLQRNLAAAAGKRGSCGMMLRATSGALMLMTSFIDSPYTAGEANLPGLLRSFLPR